MFREYCQEPLEPVVIKVAAVESAGERREWDAGYITDAVVVLYEVRPFISRAQRREGAPDLLRGGRDI
jgi:hypothetical protein